jgi:hypothetical protein
MGGTIPSNTTHIGDGDDANGEETPNEDGKNGGNKGN